MSTRTIQYAPRLLKPLLTTVMALVLSACQSGTALSPTLTGGLWSNYYMATGSDYVRKVAPVQTVAVSKAQTAKPAAAPATPAPQKNLQPNCVLQTVAFEAAMWNDRLPPEGQFGTNSLDFIKGVYNKVCQPTLQAVHGERLKHLWPKGLNPASVVVFGEGDKRIAALVEKCGADGTCQAVVRLPSQVYTIKFNANYPHVYQNKGGEVINTLIKVPGAARVATAGELILEAHQAYGRGQPQPSVAANDD